MRSVLVTGGTVRLGAVIAERLRAEGWQVLTSSHRADAGADFVADLTRVEGADRLFAAVCERLHGQCPDALVNNAALFRGEAAMVLRLNFEAPRRLIELMAEPRRETSGAVVNILDAKALSAADDAARSAAYGEAKRALLAYTRTAAIKFKDRLRVNGVAPGPVLGSSAVHEAAGATPLGRPAPAAVAEAVGFLLQAPATSGCVIPVDGGQWLTAKGAAL